MQVTTTFRFLPEIADLWLVEAPRRPFVRIVGAFSARCGMRATTSRCSSRSCRRGLRRTGAQSRPVWLRPISGPQFPRGNYRHRRGGISALRRAIPMRRRSYPAGSPLSSAPLPCWPIMREPSRAFPRQLPSAAAVSARQCRRVALQALEMGTISGLKSSPLLSARPARISAWPFRRVSRVLLGGRRSLAKTAHLALMPPQESEALRSVHLHRLPRGLPQRASQRQLRQKAPHEHRAPSVALRNPHRFRLLRAPTRPCRQPGVWTTCVFAPHRQPRLSQRLRQCRRPENRQESRLPLRRMATRHAPAAGPQRGRFTPAN